MNSRTTFVLLILAVAGAVLYWLGPAFQPLPVQTPKHETVVDGGTLHVLNLELVPAKVSRIRIEHGGQELVLDRSAGGDWSLPGKWPTRKPEVEELVGVVCGLHSRFEPIPVTDPGELKNYGLNAPPVMMQVHAGDKDYHLAFGEEPADSNHFSRATFVRLDENPEVVRLAPRLLMILERPADYYQQRRLFPSERVAKDAESPEKVDQLAAQSVSVKGPSATYSLAKSEDWTLTEPVRDHVDPDKLKTILSAVPDIWAEKFIDRGKKDLSEFGLKDPTQSLRVVRSGGDTVTLLIGKQSQVKTRTVMRPAPNMGGGPPMPPQREEVHEEYRYAKLQDNDQVFEIKADKLKELFVAAETLRDPRLARFRTEDVRRLEIDQGGHQLVLTKDKDRWKLEKPLAADAETSKITELLDKLSFLEARDKDILDKADPKSFGLDKPAAVLTVGVEEEVKGTGETKQKKSKSYKFQLGKENADKTKLYARLEGLDRISAVDNSLLKLVQRPALAYRGRRVFDFTTSDLAKLDVQRGAEHYTLDHAKDAWRLTAPAAADADSIKASQVAGDLGRLEAVEFVNETPSPEMLDKDYGLAKPALTAKVAFTDAKKPAETILFGKSRTNSTEYFAKLADKPAVFVVKKDIRDALDVDSLAYRPAQLWQLFPENIKQVDVQKGGQSFALKHEGDIWKINGPFTAVAPADTVRPVIDELANLRCERYAAHSAKDLKAFGLDKPLVTVTFDESPKQDTGKTPPKKRSLVIGGPTDKDPKSRYAKLGDGDGVFVIGEKVVTALDHGALDFLDRNLLALDTQSIERVQVTGSGGPLTLQRQDARWNVIDTPAPTFPADSTMIASVLGVWSNLRAQRYEAFGNNLNMASYGLAPPVTSITLSQKPVANSKQSTPSQHVLLLGKPVPGHADSRFARVDGGPGVVVLGPEVVSALTHGYLDFVNRSVLTFDAGQVASIRRQAGSESLEIAKKDRDWRMLKPTSGEADNPTLDTLLQDLAKLQAQRIEAYPAKDLKPFGLDDPAAVVTIQLVDAAGKGVEHVLKIGKQATDKGPDERYALVDKGDAVIVLSGALIKGLLAPPLGFRDRNLARLSDVQRVRLDQEEGSRKAAFAKSDGTWKLTEPLEADAEQAELDDFVNTVSRLRADELVADKTTDLKKYGLDRPEYRWRFQAGEKVLLDLLIGGVEKAGAERRFAKLAGQEMVFLLSPALTKQATTEYRSRSVWTGIDASQVERLQYGHPTAPFVLVKTDNDWHIEGKPQAIVKTEAVRETLDALAGLKALRYVNDTGADLKLYGLEPPQLTLDVQTKTGKHVLRIGRGEGDSKRLYAQVPQGSRSAVFVLSEEDARKINRNAASFGKEPAKPTTPTP